MVLEAIIKSRFALTHPLAMLFFAIAITTVSMGISIATFPDYSSVLCIAFITIGSMPVLFQIFTQEETEEAEHPASPATFLERHFNIISVFVFLFIGIAITYCFWYLYLPTELGETIFAEQDKNLERIGQLRGQATAGAALMACESHDFWALSLSCIFANNAVVLIWSLILAFFYGAGAIFLIAWNASVVGIAVGQEILVNGLSGGLIRAIGLIPHGIFEIGGYVVGAIAGGIISAAIAKKIYLKKEFEIIIKDVIILVIIAFILVLLGALLEGFLLLSG
ncbi:stage II sporulation protein M [Candidatus Micrarchaeota archaeon]|nr:stage II sporulation protein M [Candidatus Micrarchaeota archaeon]MBU1930129.1 stage II sporulation protein M [Candidatus Micrarchaeota archaeon]